ncbi:Tn3 family transposase [Spirosoma areae]
MFTRRIRTEPLNPCLEVRTFWAFVLNGSGRSSRIKNFLRQQLYGLEPVSRYKDLNYPVSPSGRINSERILEQWDPMLRLMTTIRLHHSSPSELFNLLNSYGADNPLYRGLKEFAGPPVRPDY